MGGLPSVFGLARFATRQARLASLCMMLGLFTARVSVAAPPKASKETELKAKRELEASVAEAATALSSTNDNKIKRALLSVQVLGKSADRTAPLITTLLERGLPDDTAVAALEALGETESTHAGASAVGIAYLTHRSPSVRGAAAHALRNLGGFGSEFALALALGDFDPGVRGTAALALGHRKATGVTPRLLVALDRGLAEASTAIGSMCFAKSCDEIVSRLSVRSFDVIAGGIDAMLFRLDLPEAAKLVLVQKMRDLGTLDANKFLSYALKRWSGSPKVQAALEEAVLATGSGVVKGGT